MSYGIIGTGQTIKKQALGAFDNLARLEQQRQIANENMRQAERQQRNSMIGMTAGYAASEYAVPAAKEYFANKAAAKELAAQGVEQTGRIGMEIGAKNLAATDAALGEAGKAATQKVTEQAVTKAGEQAAIKVGEQVAANAAGNVAAGTAAGTTGTTVAAGTGGAVGGAAGAGAGAAGAGAGAGAAGGGAAASTGVLGAMGPVGWMALAGLLAFSIFD